MAVTLRSKRYVFVCGGCGLLADTQRRDQLTCSPTCRVRFHRNRDRVGQLRRDADRYHVSVGSILQCAAIDVLRPDLGNQILAGTLTIDEAMPDVLVAFDARVWAASRSLTMTTAGNDGGASRA